MAFTGSTVNEQHEKAKKQRIPCKYKDDLFISHGVGKQVKPSRYASSASAVAARIGMILRRSVKMGSVSAGPQTGKLQYPRTLRARASRNTTLSRKYALFKQMVTPQQSAQAVCRFFDSETVVAYFDRTKPVPWDLVIGKEVGALIAELFARDHEFVADDPQVRLIKALQHVDGCGNADEDHSDDDRDEGGVGPHYAATISSRDTFLQVLENVKNGPHTCKSRRSCRFTEKSLP
jgi:hypothetical protein